MKYNNASKKDLDHNLNTLIQGIITSSSERKPGLFLTGNTGVGKTHILHAIRNGIRNRDKSNVENWVELLFELKDRMNSGSLKYFISDITSREYVFIDDIGAEKSTEWSQEMLYLVVNRLYEAGNHLFIATNLNPVDFSKRYGDRIASRILEMCEIKDITGNDRRI